MPRPLTNGTPDGQRWPASWAREPFLYLTTVGRRTGQAHRIEIWFAARGGRLYLLAGSRERTDWVCNLQANARVTVELGDESHIGMARLLEAGAAEDHLARELLLAKYSGSEDDLDEWGRTSRAVVVAFPAAAS
jgi:deazaflavin-dependent oxidoreductase (nitroreductase family)